ncbi:putative outer membrane protein [Oceaniovalibus guishaninsula JLT2003]|uniref:Putative outer membrane protein n=1 Tax=Oceaniovalibus guishaninsula JLT2003 TaxID=1231392 RepID=K2I6D6_9RHOB|nr:putative outer membrane protein [Oceaniovalibus guishaninsula JLT2003]
MVGLGRTIICAAGIAAVTCAHSVAAQDITFRVAGGGELEEKLRNVSLLVAADAEDVTDPQELLADARAEYGRLIGALYAEARYGAVINVLVNGTEAARIPPLARIGRIDSITVNVDPGPRYRFSQTRIDPLAPGTELPDGFAVREPARSPIIEDAAAAAVGGWRDVGMAKAEIADQTVVAQHERNTLAVDIDIAPGPRVTFGNLVLQGDTSVRPERLRAIAGLPTGEVFSPEELNDAARRLRETGVFSSVALTEADALGPGNRMDIIAQLAAQKPRRIGFGAEVSTVDGAALTAFWLHRNLLGGAERLRFDASVSGIGGQTDGMDYGIKGRFERPATFNPETNFFIEGEIAHLDEPDFESDTASLAFGYTRRVNDALTVSAALGLRYASVTDDAGDTDYLLVNLPMEGVYDTRDAPLNATEGFYLKAGLTPFAGLNDATGTGGRLTVDGRAYLGLGAENRVMLAGRVQAGSILGADLEEVPNDYRFYSGGGGTVRGTEYQSLGVTLDNGVDSGGASFVGLQAELRGQVTQRIGLVGFVDYGIVGRDSFPGSDSDDQAGAGLGLRYLTPIGPIRLDVAAPVMGDDDNGVEVYVGIGQAF